MENNLRKIGILTSGGDAPGMNAAIRAVVRTAIYHNMEVYGIRHGYQGMIDGDIFRMQTTDVANIIQRGGTILKTARSKAFLTEEGRAEAYRQLQQHGIEALVLIGGDGTFRGAVEFFKQFTIPAVGLPGTIDKDLSGTDFTIGFDTAVNTAVEAIDKIRDTADAHDRLFVVEVMGRDAGYIALNSGIACGAEDILIPEVMTHIDDVLDRIDVDERRKKNVHILVVAEGDEFGGAQLGKLIKDRFPDIDTRIAVLGHIQRGGSPSYADRVLASRLGYAAVMALRENRTQVMAGIINGQLAYTPFEQVIKQNAMLSSDMLEMIRVLSI
ncbi:6-phosphofructokinase [Chitinophagaceae bacterium MMS25-I14]